MAHNRDPRTERVIVQGPHRMGAKPLDDEPQPQPDVTESVNVSTTIEPNGGVPGPKKRRRLGRKGKK